MAKRRSKNYLHDWEISIVKAMLHYAYTSDQKILAYFTRPERTINHRVIAQTRTGKINKGIPTASKDDMEIFISNHPFIDWDTGLHLYNDELLIKAREAMLNAVQTYNNPKTNFRAEIFIVSAVIAWTYLLHAFFKREGIDYRKYEKGIVKTTKTGRECFLGLQECLDNKKCTVDDITKKNLGLLLEIRHEIEHKCTQKIDASISKNLQSCCMNFNNYIKEYFGDRLGLDKDLSFALQFSRISLEQQKTMAQETNLPASIKLTQEKFEAGMSYEQLNDQRYAISFDLVIRASNNANKADGIVTLADANSPESDQPKQIVLKRFSPETFKPKTIVKKMNDSGFSNFRMHEHTVLKKKFNPQHANKTGNTSGKYGVWADNSWFYSESWLNKIKEYCQEHGEGHFAPDE